MSYLRAQIRGLDCKIDGPLFWEEEPYFAHGTKNHFTLFCKRNSSEIRKFQALMTVTVRLVPESEKKLAMARSCCIPDLLALKGLRTLLRVVIPNGSKKNLTCMLV